MTPRTSAGRSQLTTGNGRERLETLYSKAGRPADWPVARLMAYKVYALAGAALLGMLLLLLTDGNGMIVLMVAVMVPVSYFVPELLLYSRGTERQKAIGLELADTLDQMMIAVEAGLGFESAMARAGHSGKGPLAEELVRTLQEMRVGIPRRDAYLALEQRTDVPDLRSSPGQSSRPTPTASPSPRCCAPRPTRCGSSDASGPRRPPKRSPRRFLCP